MNKRFCPAEVAPNASTCALDLFITNLTQEGSAERAEIMAVTSVEGLKKVILWFLIK